MLVTVEHSLWTASEDESDFSLCVGLVKHVTIDNTEKVIEVSIALRVLVHALLHVVANVWLCPHPSSPHVPYYLQRVWLVPNFKLSVFFATYGVS